MSWWWVISRSTWRGGRGGGRTRTRTHKQQERHEEVVLINNLRIHPPGAARRLLPLARGARAWGEACCCFLSLRVTQVVVVVVGPASQLHGGCHALVLVLVRLHFTSLHFTSRCCCCCCCFVTYPCVVCVFCTFCPCSRLSSP